jgi:hypothetical protein
VILKDIWDIVSEIEEAKRINNLVKKRLRFIIPVSFQKQYLICRHTPCSYDQNVSSC